MYKVSCIYSEQGSGDEMLNGINVCRKWNRIERMWMQTIRLQGLLE